MGIGICPQSLCIMRWLWNHLQSEPLEHHMGFDYTCRPFSLLAHVEFVANLF